MDTRFFTLQGVPEDLLFFYEHLRKGGGVVRVDQSLLLYRYHPSAATHSVLEYAGPGVRTGWGGGGDPVRSLPQGGGLGVWLTPGHTAHGLSLWTRVFLRIRAKCPHFYYLFPLLWVFAAEQAISSCSEQGMLSSFPHCGGFSCCGAQALGTWTSVVAAQDL